MRFRRSLSSLILSLSFVSLATAASLNAASKAANSAATSSSPFVGYLATYFLGNNPKIFMQLSNGNDPYSFSPLNGVRPILTPILGSTGARDPCLVTSPDRTRFWIIATDLDIDKMSWGDSVRVGSKSIHVWESSDLVSWKKGSLKKVENDEAGMVWAPSATYDSAKGVYSVFWSSKFYSVNDKNHTQAPVTDSIIRYTTTKDFISFSPPATYLTSKTEGGLIDQDFQALGQAGHFARFLKVEGNNVNRVYQETTTDGIMSKNWVRVGGPNGFVTTEMREGPASFQDNLDPGKFHLWLDNYAGQGGYEPYETDHILQGGYTKSNAPTFPRGIRHGSVIPVTQEQYDALDKLRKPALRPLGVIE
ncbi:hypothetical protein CBS101457_005730 [Exobasidium rhododendri]|nr:hypothetical protein CBS101457_005730 [Exobasidium rhododendri]